MGGESSSHRSSRLRKCEVPVQMNLVYAHVISRLTRVQIEVGSSDLYQGVTGPIDQLLQCKANVWNDTLEVFLTADKPSPDSFEAQHKLPRVFLSFKTHSKLTSADPALFVGQNHLEPRLPWGWNAKRKSRPLGRAPNLPKATADHLVRVRGAAAHGHPSTGHARRPSSR